MKFNIKIGLIFRSAFLRLNRFTYLIPLKRIICEKIKQLDIMKLFISGELFSIKLKPSIILADFPIINGTIEHATKASKSSNFAFPFNFFPIE